MTPPAEETRAKIEKVLASVGLRAIPHHALCGV
jgi:hypothetical protein